MKKLLESLLAISMMFQVAIIPTMAQEEEPIDDSPVVEESEVTETEDEIVDEESIDEETEAEEIIDEQEEVTEEVTQAAEHWKKESNGKWRYYLSDGSYVKNYEYRCTDGKYYYFDGNGYMVTGWVYVEGENSVTNKTGWRYYNSDSVSGWQKINNVWYYFIAPYNIMVQYDFIVINDKEYSFDDNGAWAEKGWHTFHGLWYYFDSPTQLHNGWLKYGNHWYYCVQGYMMFSDSFYINGFFYYFDSKGHMVTDKWIKIDDYWHYYGSDGKEVSGWKKIKGKWYYFNPSDENRMVYGRRYTIDGKDYIFSVNGEMLEKGWNEFYEGAWFYMDTVNKPHNGWLKYGNYWYYCFDGGVICDAAWPTEDGYYCFDSYGHMVSNKWYYWEKFGLWFYSEEDGNIVKGWKKINNVWYYFSTGYEDSAYVYSGAMVTDCTLELTDGYTYTFDSNGAWTRTKTK